MRAWGFDRSCTGCGDRWTPRTRATTSLLALFVLTRVGAWFLVAAWFWISATVSDPVTGEVLQGRAALDALRDGFLWVPAAFVAALAVNLLAGWFLGRRARRGAD